MVVEALRAVEHFETVWIPMPDGIRLAARIWRPADSHERPVPAILEQLPYRRRDFTRLRGDDTQAYWAVRGYAGVRVDLRGAGDSEGLIDDEYSPQELADCVAVIAWLAEQPWCSGEVGMFGISWGGFNALQVAALRPPALKAIITCASTDDRYADDVHYMGGCLISEQLSWANTMFGFNSRPPDPEVVGERWREMWLERLEKTNPWMLTWLSHQRRDEQWKHGSICENYADVEAAVYAIGGWADGYSNAIPRLLASLPGPRKGLIGPWPHAWPHLATPGPRIGWLQEALRWWDQWLKGKDSGIMDEPMLQAWMQEPLLPAAFYAHRPGRWVAEEAWPSPRIEDRVLVINADALAATAGTETSRINRSPQTHGVTAGEWCPYGFQAEMPEDQRLEDGQALVFESEVLTEALEILGTPVLELELAVDQPVAFLCGRLSDVFPDGPVQQVTYGLQNLTHDASHESVTRLTPGARQRVRLQMNDIAHHFPAGHRIRLALSTSYWPRVWPSPRPVTLTLFTGVSKLHLPVRPPSAGDTALPDFAEPETGIAGPHSQNRPAERGHRITRDINSERVILDNFKDRGLLTLDEIDLTIGAIGRDTHSLVGDDPLSAEHRSDYTITMTRADWSIRTEASTTMTATESEFLLSAKMEAYEGEVRVFTKTWDKRIPRDGC